MLQQRAPAEPLAAAMQPEAETASAGGPDPSPEMPPKKHTPEELRAALPEGDPLAPLVKALQSGDSIVIFPEGTRSSDGRLLQFRPGAFEIAKRAQQPILPVLIRGTADALPKRGFILRGRHPISVEVLDELAPESFSGLDTEQLALEVRQIFAERLGEDGQNEPVRAAG